MSLHYILDGYNIIKQDDFLIKIKLKDAREGLLKLIKENRLCASKHNSITVVFDGKEDFSSKTCQDVEIIFTKNGSADDKIKSMVEQADNPKRIVVVSDDREIQLFVKSLGAKTLLVKSFVQRSKNKIESFPVSKEELPSPKARAITEELKKIWLK